MTVERLDLFPVRLFKTKVTNHEKIKKYLMDNIYPAFLENGPNDVLQNAYTDYMPGAKPVLWNFLSEMYREDIVRLLTEAGIDFKHPWQVKFKCWYGFTTHSTREFVHDHTGGPSQIQFAAVHYVHLEEDKTGTVFLDPNFRKNRSILPTKNMDYIPDYFTREKEQPDVVEGDMIMFPSWIDHHTPATTEGKLRLMVAMNIMLRVDDKDGY